ncbi:MAG TPA: hypothetical protein VM008_00550 [Phycisphaerae bacterium]|nr:hypothetical protein [Phycisphaerae bacterium]
MREPIKASADVTGVPCAEVPCASMWDLVEYLSFQRVSVTYQYQASHFIVAFPHQDIESAQRVLDEWVHAGAGILQPN